MRKKASETRLYRAEMNEKILNSGFREFNKFFALDTNAYQEGAISVANKELMGLVGSMVLRCNDCIFYHLDRCVTEGCTRQEIYEALHISLVIGGSIVIPHLRYAFEMLEELEAAASASTEAHTPPSELPPE
ncbi:MAG: carboxymuconolactone decarboxylase family protein [Fimbriimonas sp.]